MAYVPLLFPDRNFGFLYPAQRLRQHRSKDECGLGRRHIEMGSHRSASSLIPNPLRCPCGRALMGK